MKTIYIILMFMILFNIASVAIAFTGFFGSDVLYGDIVSENPEELVNASSIMDTLFFDPLTDSYPSVGIEVPIFGFVGLTLNWATVTTGIFIAALTLTFVTKSHASPIICAAIVGAIFLLMWSNSKKLFDSMVGSLDQVALYVALMVAVGFFFMLLITVMDYLSGQDAASGR